MTTKVLFLCPHAAAKSVFAAGALAHAAADRQLDLQVWNAGTEPDPEVLGLVRDRLVSNDMEVAGPPRLVVAADFEAADVVVNIGCDLDGFAPTPSTDEWAIPNFSEDAAAAFAALEQHVAGLVDRLANEAAG